MDKILAGVDDDNQPQGKKRKLAVKEPEHQETSAEDIEVGKYEMERKNWKAALSRFESAMVLAPDEPEVYWGWQRANGIWVILLKRAAITRKWLSTTPTASMAKRRSRH